MAECVASLKMDESDKPRFDKACDVSGGLSHRRMVAALLNGWEMLSLDQQIEAIRSTARTPDPAETSAA